MMFDKVFEKIEKVEKNLEKILQSEEKENITTIEERKKKDTKSQTEKEKRETTLQKLERKGLHPLKNVDIIALLFYSFFLPLALELIKRNYIRSAIAVIAFAVIFAATIIISKKGDIAVILRDILHSLLIRLGRKAINERNKDANLSIWERLDK